jgi:hypothetical protein
MAARSSSVKPFEAALFAALAGDVWLLFFALIEVSVGDPCGGSYCRSDPGTVPLTAQAHAESMIGDDR